MSVPKTGSEYHLTTRRRWPRSSVRPGKRSICPHISTGEIRRDLAGQLSDSAGELRDAAEQVRSMVRRLTPLWVGIIAPGGLLLGMLLMYFFTLAGKNRRELWVGAPYDWIIIDGPPRVNELA